MPSIITRDFLTNVEGRWFVGRVQLDTGNVVEVLFPGWVWVIGTIVLGDEGEVCSFLFHMPMVEGAVSVDLREGADVQVGRF